MALNNKDQEEMIDNDDLSINLDNLDLPEIPDLEDNFSDFNFQLEQENREQEVSELNQNNLDKTQSIDEIEVNEEIEDLKLKPISDEDIQIENDESTTLSNEELENILDVESIELKDDKSNEVEALQENDNDIEEIKLEPIEIDVADDTNSISELPKVEDLQFNNIDQEIAEESISLTEKELDDILGEGIQEDSILQTETKDDSILKIQDEDLVKKIIPDSDVEEKEQKLEEENTHLPPLYEVEAEDETISLTSEELENIVSSEEIEEISDQLSEEFDEQKEVVSDQELKSIEIPKPIFEENEENETISLTDDELHNILDDVTENISSEPTIPEPEIYEVPSENREQLADDLQKETGLKKEELKKIISYLDSLFDKLPEEAIREFSKSEYFNLYKKVIEVLEIYPKE